MNTEVIKEIANQLGIAADAVTKDVIPAYAQYQIWHNVCCAILSGILFIIFLFFIIFSTKKGIAARKNHEYDDANDYFADASVAKIFAILIFIFLFISIKSAFIWTYSPYGAFINILIK